MNPAIPLRPEESTFPFLATEALELTITLDVAAGAFRFAWRRVAGGTIAQGQLVPAERPMPGLFDLDWRVEFEGHTQADCCSQWPSSIRALLKRLRKQFPVQNERVRVELLTDAELGPAKAGVAYPLSLRQDDTLWKWLAREIQFFAKTIETVMTVTQNRQEERRGQIAAHLLAHAWLGVPLALLPRPTVPGLHLRVTLELVRRFIQLEWSEGPQAQALATGTIRCTGQDELTWELAVAGQRETVRSSAQPNVIQANLQRWRQRFAVPEQNFAACRIEASAANHKPHRVEEPPFSPRESPWAWLEEQIQTMAEVLGEEFALPEELAEPLDPLVLAELEREDRRAYRKEQKRAAEEVRRREMLARLAEERRRKQQHLKERQAKEAKKTPEPTAEQKPPSTPLHPHAPVAVPPVPIRLEAPSLELSPTPLPLASLQSYTLRERAALWWVSNQSDDLLCLPHCHIQRLEYQMRTALRVLGPLRGRALLSDEVGLGKTIEAGLVLKELLTRGMVKRFLVLTVPSLVDQWEEELNDKFGLVTATTNQAGARADGERFWRENPGIIASLHTLKQPAQLAVAQQVHWDLLIVDEAHYLRNRESQAWQAVSALPRQYLLLLTATPVQNSLEELYNLVTLLKPGQLPTPKEFRARFIDPKRPRQPREPEELRGLLGQVMIRNTRANAGLHLPPRHAETVLFEPQAEERAFWQQWESEFRARLQHLNASQASMWGRLLLQAAGSSPAAWREALEKFPDRAAARAWREQAPLEGSWQHKCQLLQPLTRGEGGVVIFTQFLQTQAALAEYLRRSNVPAFVINGATPPPERQPITEEFHRHGGALLLTHSGTEGRNLQFAHRLANFDLPWNPMEIEQRIGRLHRLGQQHPVRIFNFVQTGTLQEHLLQLLQEKLNLFELVVGETGLILGDRFSSEEFAEEVLRRWRESEGRVAEALAGLGEELAAARNTYGEVKQLDETLFSEDYESV